MAKREAALRGRDSRHRRMTRTADIWPASLPPRGLSRVEAAAYIGTGATKFDEMVVDGRMPKPKRIDARIVWDRHKLDEYFEALPGDEDRNPWEEAVP